MKISLTASLFLLIKSKLRKDWNWYCRTYLHFIKILYDIHDLDNLTRQDICLLINKIIVHPKIKKRKSTLHNIEIYYNFIGKID